MVSNNSGDCMSAANFISFSFYLQISVKMILFLSVMIFVLSCNTANPVSSTITAVHQAGMVKINAAGNSFQMGSSTDNDQPSAAPVHTVNFTYNFWMDTVEVTQADYYALMGFNPAVHGDFGCPVENVTWFDAVLYCNARSKANGKDTAYSYTSKTISSIKKGNRYISQCTAIKNLVINYKCEGYRLPTEAEWEYACRGGTKTSFYFVYFGEQSVNTHAWYYYNSYQTTHAGALKTPNLYGLYDMSGNVSEWCNDYCGNYSNGSQTDPIGVSTGSQRVTRGGSFDESFVKRLRSAERGSLDPGSSYGNTGFRVVIPDTNTRAATIFPAITGQAHDTTVTIDSKTGLASAMFSVAATGDYLKFQWQVHTVNGWTNLAGSNKASYLFYSQNSGIYRCIASNSLGQVVSDSVHLTVIQPFISLVSPIRDTILTVNESVIISWADNIDGNITIDLYSKGTFLSTVTNAGVNDTMYVWTVPENTPDSSEYTLRITADSTNSRYWAESAKLKIVNPSFRAVLTPEENQSLTNGAVSTISWKGHIGSNVSIDLYKGNDSILRIADSITGVTSYSWNVLADTGSGYSLKITDNTNPAIFIFSKNFSITSNISLNITSPSYGSVLKCGSTYSIVCNCNLPIQTLSISLYKGGSFKASIATILNIPSGKYTYNWSIPYAGYATGFDYSIHLSASTANGVKSVTGGEFEIDRNL
jgi:formylglycine-generating enzyme required for sulfatase activity